LARHQWKHARAGFFLGVSLVLATSPALAGSRQAQERTARTSCLSGDYAKGVAILSELFVDTKDATYIFNQGRCFEQNSRYQDAIARFQEYLRTGKKLSESDKADAQKHIADCEDMLAKQNRAAEVASTPPPPPPAAPAPVVEVPAIVQPASPPSASGEPGVHLRTAGVVTAAAGGAALVTGLILNLKVNSMASDFQTLNGYTDSKESQRKSYETWGWVSYGVGAGCVATGAVLYYLGSQAGKNGNAGVALLPAFAPGTAGAVLTGAF